jgi:hypothetical protein
VPTSQAEASATVSCPAGELALGGGAEVLNAPANQAVSIIQSVPNPTTGSPTGWTGSAEQNQGGNTVWLIRVWVICTA